MIRNRMVKIMRLSIGGIIMLLMVAGCSGVMEAELLPVEDNGGDAIVVLHNLSKGKEGKYKVMVLYESEPIAYLPIENGKAVFEAHRMLPGSCYTFDIVTAKDSKSVGKVKWRNLEICCVPESDELVEPIDDLDGTVPSATLSYDCEPNRNGTYTVILHSRNMNGVIIFTLGKKMQKDSIFQDVLPGSYQAEAKIEDGKHAECLVVLDKIADNEGKEDPLTPSDVQNTFDKVCNGSITAGQAQLHLARGEVKLAVPVRNCVSLMELLHEMEMGAMTGDRFCVTVISFENDPKSGRIRSGSLKIQEQSKKNVS